MNENIKVTEKLIDVIRYERTQKRISAQDLSVYIDKSKTYISTLERNKIDVLKGDLLYKIFEKIFNSSNKELCNYINSVIGKLCIGIPPTEKNTFYTNEKWILQLCLVLNQIPLNDSIIEFIESYFIHFHKTVSDLTRKINENIMLNDAELEETNTLYVYENGNWSYKFKITDEVITDILDRNVNSINYVTMFAIISNIYLLTGSDDIITKTKDYLKEHSFYDAKDLENLENMNISMRKSISASSYFFNLPVYNDAFNNNLKSIRDIVLNFKSLNFDLAEKMVTNIEKNLSNDIELMSVIYSIPFHSIFKNLNKEQKQHFLTLLSELITKTSDN